MTYVISSGVNLGNCGEDGKIPVTTVTQKRMMTKAVRRARRGSVGGSLASNLDDLWEFNLANKTWTWVSGSSTGNASGVYGVQGVAAATDIPGGRSNSASWIDSSGNLWLFGGIGTAGVYSGYFNDLWLYHP
jgi:hypothetical protein